MESITEHWFTNLYGYHDQGRRHALTDAEISAAVPFEGHQEKFLDWHRDHWDDHKNDVPCRDPGKNAYHIQSLAKAMEEQNQWIGHGHDNLFVIYPSGEAREGNHRIRAVRYLHDTKGIVIPMPRIDIFLCRYFPGSNEDYSIVRCSRPLPDLPAIERIYVKLQERIADTDRPDWLECHRSELGGRSALECINAGEFTCVQELLR
jgi:hypothetical protein